MRLSPLCTLVALLLASCASGTASGVTVAQASALPAPALGGSVRLSAALAKPEALSAPGPLAKRVLEVPEGSAAVQGAYTWGLLAAGTEQPLPNATVTLLDPDERYYRASGRPIVAVSDLTGTYRFQANVPQKVPLWVAAAVGGDRRLVGFTVADGPRRLDLGQASTYVAERLRQAARGDGKALAGYALAGLAAVTAATQALLGGGELAEADLVMAHASAADARYALAIAASQPASDAWLGLLGRRPVAVVTVAGDGRAGPAGDGGLAVLASLYHPVASVSDKRGNVYVSDAGAHQVRRVDAETGVVTIVAGVGLRGFGGDGGLAVQARLDSPAGLALDPLGNLYIADAGNLRLRVVDAVTGQIRTLAGAPAPDGQGGWQPEVRGDGGLGVLARFYRPHALAFDPAGDLFISDGAAGAPAALVRRLDMKRGTLSTVVGVVGARGLFAGDGGPPDRAQLDAPEDLAFDAQGRLLIADSGNHCIRRVDFPLATVSTVVGVGGQAADGPEGELATVTRLSTPCGLVVTQSGRLFIANRGTGKVLTVSPGGVVSRLAGGGTSELDGDAREAKLGGPCGLSLMASGDLLVAEPEGSRLRRLTTRLGL